MLQVGSHWHARIAPNAEYPQPYAAHELGLTLLVVLVVVVAVTVVVVVVAVDDDAEVDEDVLAEVDVVDLGATHMGPSSEASRQSAVWSHSHR